MSEPNPNLQALEQFLMMDDENNSPLIINQPSSSLLQFPVAGDYRNMQPGDPIVQTLMDDEMFEDGLQTNPSTVHEELDVRWSDFGNPIQLPSWPLQVPPYTCSCCQILREITHTNGVEITKLEIHGRIGVICHGVLEKYSIDLATNQRHEFKMFDFSKESTRRVKKFLVGYCIQRKQNAYIMLQDPLSSFYKALCVGLDWEDTTVVTRDLINPEDSGDHHMTQLPYVGSSTAATTSANKPTLSFQRERMRTITITDLVGYFNLPIVVAAKKMQVCPTVIKKICRKHGLLRWPYRKIKSIMKKISMRARYLTFIEGEKRGHVQAEIDTLQQEISEIYSRVNV